MTTNFDQRYLYSGTSWKTTVFGVPLTRAPATISFTYLTLSPSYYTGGLIQQLVPDFFAPTPAQLPILDLAREAWSDVAGITWKKVAQTAQDVGDITGSLGDITFARFTDPNGQALGFYPNPVVIHPSLVSQIGGDVWIPANLAIYDTPQVGAFGYAIFLHEIGHALGLSHDGTTAEAGANWPGVPIPTAQANLLHTIMAYPGPHLGAHWPWVPAWLHNKFPVTPMLFDIAQIQLRYGLSSRANGGVTDSSGNTTWTFGDN